MNQETKYIVIGSNCFTGSHIVDYLLSKQSASKKCQVIGISRSPEKPPLFLPYRNRNYQNFRFVQLDIVREHHRLIQLCDEFQPHFIINVAALSEVYQSHLTPLEYYETNTLAVVRLADALKTRSWLERYLHISSAEVYGDCNTAVKEDVLVNPSTPYAASKAAADLHLLTSAKQFGFPVTLVRSTNVYGKHQQLYKIIPRTILNLKMGKSIGLHGGGRAIRPFIHITDVCRGIEKILECVNPSTIYHFSTTHDWPIREVVRHLCLRMGKDFAKVTELAKDRALQDQRYWLDTKKSEHELGWKPEISFEDGIEEVIHWVEENFARLKGEPLQYIHPFATPHKSEITTKTPHRKNSLRFPSVNTPVLN